MKFWLKPRKLAAVPVLKISCSGRFLKLFHVTCCLFTWYAAKETKLPATDWPDLGTQMLKVPPLELAKTWESLGRNVLKLLNKIAFQFFLNRVVELFRKTFWKSVFHLSFGCGFFYLFWNFPLSGWNPEEYISLFCRYHCKAILSDQKEVNSSGAFPPSQGGSVEKLTCRDAFVFSQLWKDLHS